jgi:hypothetical protein
MNAHTSSIPAEVVTVRSMVGMAETYPPVSGDNPTRADTRLGPLAEHRIPDVANTGQAVGCAAHQVEQQVVHR